MTHDVLLLLIEEIIKRGAATKKDGDIFKDYLPEKPDTAIGVYEYAGSASVWYSEMSVRSFQVVVRSKSSQKAMIKCWEVFHLLKDTEGVGKIADLPCVIAIRNTPVKISTDEQQRVKYAFNLGITITTN